ncbi:hypothetical protein scyTo_0022549 [Scyliorhinus torazame]|uniref:Uncharacterized protein n=1 Tax=Scyliorhinus torazame TaxID=75743 RepID=A0A401Q8H5_SCYTO|nr:hypothetical protein [Scyliorhinus torazame]
MDEGPSGSTEGDGNGEEGTSGSAQGVTPFTIDLAELLEFAEVGKQDGRSLFELNLLGDPCVNQTGDSSYTEDPTGDKSDCGVTAENPVLTFGSENTSESCRRERCDAGPAETCAGALTNSQLLEEAVVKLEASTHSGSSSSLESDGATPWVQAVLLPKRNKETKTSEAESTDKPLSNSDWLLTASPSSSEPLTPSFGEEPAEEKAADLAQLSNAATSPDEVIMDPSDVAFLQNDVWHQNQAFVPIPTAAVPETEHQGSGDEKCPEAVGLPMDCDPPSKERGDQGVGGTVAETCDGRSAPDAASTLPSYVASAHKELVGWNNEPTDPEVMGSLSYRVRALQLSSCIRSAPEVRSFNSALHLC